MPSKYYFDASFDVIELTALYTHILCKECTFKYQYTVPVIYLIFYCKFVVCFYELLKLLFTC